MLPHTQLDHASATFAALSRRFCILLVDSVFHRDMVRQPSTETKPLASDAQRMYSVHTCYYPLADNEVMETC